MHCPHCQSSDIHKVSALWEVQTDSAPLSLFAGPTDRLPLKPNFPTRPPPAMPPLPLTTTALAGALMFVGLLPVVFLAMPGLDSGVGGGLAALVSSVAALIIGAHRHRRQTAAHHVAHAHWRNFYACNTCGDLGLQDSFRLDAPLALHRPTPIAPSILALKAALDSNLWLYKSTARTAA